MEVQVQDETRKWEFQANVKEGDKNCQVNIWSQKPPMQSSSEKKHVPLCHDKNCQFTRCYQKMSQVRPMYVNDKNCQSKPISNMQSVTKSSIRQLPKPAIKQSHHKKCNSDDKSCQYDHKKCEYTKCNTDDNNCQSVKLI